MKRTVLSLFIVCCGLVACNKEASVAHYNVVPLPQEITPEQGAGFELNGNTVITYNGNEAMRRNAELLAEYVKESNGLELKVAENAKGGNTISLAIGNATGNKEGYSLSVTKEKSILIF